MIELIQNLAALKNDHLNIPVVPHEAVPEVSKR